MAAPSISEITSVLLYDEGNAWSGSQITFSFPKAGSTWRRVPSPPQTTKRSQSSCTA